MTSSIQQSYLIQIWTCLLVISSYLCDSTSSLAGSSDQTQTYHGLHKRAVDLSTLSKGIYPGTKWCGRGSISNLDTDLGYFNATDFCCREHDSCPFYIMPNEEKFGLINNRRYTVCHCACDDQLRRCLQSVGTTTSSNVGIIFFDILKTPCYTVRNITDSQGTPIGSQAFLLKQKRYTQVDRQGNAPEPDNGRNDIRDIRSKAWKTLLRGGAMAAKFAARAMAEGFD